MRKVYSSLIFSMSLFLFGCASFQTAGELQHGRQALLLGKPEAALPHFQRVAEIDPNYVARFTVWKQGVWTYIGRAYYDTQKLPQARQALERARSQNDDDYLAKVYYGLTLLRGGNRAQGAKEIEIGMKGLHDWLDYVEYYTPYGEFWDPGKKIRSELQSNLAMLSGKDIEWQKVIAGGEWVGKRMEEEIEHVRWDKRRELLREGDDNDAQP
ncbi:MAG: tetratricopeptide repeat protein [Candidatus Binatia bacterium]